MNEKYDSKKIDEMLSKQGLPTIYRTPEQIAEQIKKDSELPGEFETPDFLKEYFEKQNSSILSVQNLKKVNEEKNASSWLEMMDESNKLRLSEESLKHLGLYHK